MVELTDYLNYPISILDGAGEKTTEALHRIGCYKISDLLFHLPTRVVIKNLNPDFNSIKEGSPIIARVEIDELHTTKRNRVNKIEAWRGEQKINLVFFSKIPAYLERFLLPGKKIIVDGKLEKNFDGSFQIVHPKVYFSENKIQKMDVIYPHTYDLSSYKIHTFINTILIKLEQFIHIEWLNDEILKANNWPGWLESLRLIHNPKTAADLELNSVYRERIVFDEFLASQIAVKLMRRERELSQKGIAINCNGELVQKLLSTINFSLTTGQKSALNQIILDQKSDKRMLRLLHGDVGSGKTLVALCAILNVLESGRQGALMVPTDILANQHFNSISKMLEDSSIKIKLLTGKTNKVERSEISQGLLDGSINILIGTHALFQDAVNFKDLGLIVIDEQHRFGVQQRLKLIAKQDNVDVLVMSATPIPRTLALTIYGDMDISLIQDKPKGRLPIKTYTVLDSKLDPIIRMIEDTIQRNERVYWVCPLIEGEDEETQNTGSVEFKKTFLESRFPGAVGMLHGKMNALQKEEVMKSFIKGKVKILVSTTVIEVGVDVPDATLLIIDRAEKFGLAQLHQLRGRVGRSDRPSSCVLLFSEDIGYIAKQRLQVMKESNDGFYIAEEDFKLRGSGEILGTKQSGLPDFKTSYLEVHSNLLLRASQHSEIAMRDSSKFLTLLKIFGYNENIKLVEAS